MPISLQAKLLRAVENREIRRVGGEQIIKTNARIIAATNRNLYHAVAEGTFRQDLYYRLGAFTIFLPPLREHPEDIPFLVQEFIAQSNEKFKTNVTSVSTEVMSFLIKYSWPGNVRELKHAIEHAVVVASNTMLQICDFPNDLIWAHEHQPEFPAPLNDNLERQEQKLIEAALRRHRGRRNEVARELNISPVTLWRKMKHYGLSDTSYQL